MISVIISTYNSEKYIKTCIDAVLKSVDVEFEIIRVDCGQKSLGLTVTHNIGAKMAWGEYLLFLDVDTKIDKNALFEIVKFFEKNKDCGAVQGKIETTGHFLSIFGFPYEVNDGRRVIFGARTACMAIRRSVFEEIGGFDEDFFMHNEETDLSWRVWLAGYRIYYLERAKCQHFGKSSYVNNRTFCEGAKNQITMILKNADLKMILWMLPLNILGWMILGLKSRWVYRGIGRAFLNIRKTIEKRKKVIRKKGNEAEKVMFGDIGVFALIAKGLGWLRSL